MNYLQIFNPSLLEKFSYRFANNEEVSIFTACIITRDMHFRIKVYSLKDIRQTLNYFEIVTEYSIWIEPIVEAMR